VDSATLSSLRRNSPRLPSPRPAAADDPIPRSHQPYHPFPPAAHPIVLPDLAPPPFSTPIINSRGHRKPKPALPARRRQWPPMPHPTGLYLLSPLTSISRFCRIRSLVRDGSRNLPMPTSFPISRPLVAAPCVIIVNSSNPTKLEGIPSTPRRALYDHFQFFRLYGALHIPMASVHEGAGGLKLLNAICRPMRRPGAHRVLGNIRKVARLISLGLPVANQGRQGAALASFAVSVECPAYLPTIRVLG